jgi:AraC family transcriptional regulator of adaptative response/methylated-DNA-[protein]-cysteine methyltransferase
MMNDRNLTQQSDNYQRVAAAIQYLEQNFQAQPSLEEVAAGLNLSKYHFQRIFKSWAGVTPSQFSHYLTLEYAKERLRESRSLLETSLEAGLSGPGRLHDLFVTFEAMTPGEFKKGGAGLEIHYGFHPTPFGPCILALTERGICALRFLSPDGSEIGLANLKTEWPQAKFIENPSRTAPVIGRLFAGSPHAGTNRFHLLLKGTNFQVQVWQALLAMPPGLWVSYGDLASAMGKPTAARAVANAVARNPIAYLIPCHRVINRSGAIHRYRWGAPRKKAILGWEAARG